MSDSDALCDAFWALVLFILAFYGVPIYFAYSSANAIGNVESFYFYTYLLKT